MKKAYAFALFFILLACKAYAKNQLIIDGSTGVKPLVEALVKDFKKTHPQSIKIGSGLNPKDRIQALVENKIDIAMASHGVDIERLTDQGFKVHLFAKMAVVIGVNVKVNIDNISHQQLCDIYTGKTKNWQKLGGKKVPIKPFVRPFDEVDTEVLVAQIPCFSRLLLSPDVKTKKKSGQMAKALSQTAGAIGITTLVRVTQSDGTISALPINGINPSSTNLINKRYPFTRDSFLITAKSPSPNVLRFLAYIYSEQGKKVILANSAVPSL
ncbi:substrate-binding domain-containing protein [Glaciecola petra]|uniref:Substrate-binding domain-containing protein n=1 Tax=Glaciecola petra TaxID=3075602 RepID=A0ABU2ZS24_9ALTE|nr:substrate-binding domain-containing protein [Aestuariibacter sp. P117]MDT0595119.1 substrate-binding domain-containing protein [Aestuariibacter sp. P117]